MRKILSTIFIMLMAVAFTACSKTPKQSENGTLPEIDPTSKILIAYFTWAENTVLTSFDSINVDASASASLKIGNTAILASHIQEITKGDLFSILVMNPYPNDYNECLNQANQEKSQNARPELKNTINNMDEYEIVFLGYPNWWYTIPMAVHTFLESYDFSGKTIIPFCAHGTGGLASSVKDIRASIPNAQVLDAIGIYRNDMSQAEILIKSWLENLGFTKREES